jgi:hypothetical protein
MINLFYSLTFVPVLNPEKFAGQEKGMWQVVWGKRQAVFSL